MTLAILLSQIPYEIENRLAEAVQRSSRDAASDLGPEVTSLKGSLMGQTSEADEL